MDLYSIRNQLSMGIPLTNINLRVVDYARVSTDTNEQKKSLQNQVEHFSKYIEENPNWTYIKSYVDEGITGTSDVKRNNFMEMIDDAREGKFDLIVTKEISRFSRNTLDSIKYTRELLSYGVAVLFVNDNINTAQPDSELRLTIMASMAQDEVRRLSERVKFGMHRAIDRGEILGNDLLYGYKKDKDTGTLNIIEKEAEVVKRIYYLYTVEELSLSKITKILNYEDIKTSQGKKWSTSVISRMIENPKYKGFYCAKKTEIIDYMTKKVKYIKKKDWIVYENKNKIPPIIDEYLWEKANNRLQSRKKSFSNRKKDKTLYKNRFLYSAKIYCLRHNTVFHRREFRRNKKDITWVCSIYLKEGKKVCDSPNLRETELDIILTDIIEVLKINYKDAVKLLIGYYKKLKVDTLLDDDIIFREKELKNIYLKKDKLLELSINNNITDKEFKVRNNLFNEEINNINKELANLKNQKKKISESDNSINILLDILNKKVLTNEINNKIISLILNKIVVFKEAEDNIKLDVFLSYIDDDYSNKNSFFTKEYQFKRGYDTKGTRRYIINYKVNFYL